MHLEQFVYWIFLGVCTDWTKVSLKQENGNVFLKGQRLFPGRSIASIATDMTIELVLLSSGVVDIKEIYLVKINRMSRIEREHGQQQTGRK